jgi:hypothetical protein
MRPKRQPRLRRAILILIAAPLGLCLLAGLASALSNLGLPTQSTVVEHLSPLDKARLAEANHLLATLGSGVWPGWGEQPAVFVVYNEANVFLVGFPSEAAGPPPGWTKVPQQETRGGPWEPVPDDTFYGQTYYRQALEDPSRSPQAFVVLIGEQWAASFQTKEYTLIWFASDMRGSLPPVVREVVPYRLMWSFLMGETEAYVGSLLHEAFHAYQGSMARERLEEAERVMAVEDRYPFEAASSEWQAEVNLLADAALSGSAAEAADLARQFLAQRDARRAAAGLTGELVDFERQREWLEGLAKYAELKIGLLAATAAGYQPRAEVAEDPEFKGYANRDRAWTDQLGQMRNMLGTPGEARFYYTGLAQAAVLDRLAPGWQAGAFDAGVWLEDLLREAVAEP